MPISQTVYDLCHAQDSVTSELAKHPDKEPGDVWHSLVPSKLKSEVKALKKHDNSAQYSAEDLKRAFECGKWGNTRPSDLFLKIYHDVLCTLNEDLSAGVVSPSLMGSSGVLPLTVISGAPDIVRHISNCIARAEKEVYLATNFWKYGDTTTLVTNALKELSKRAGERGHKVVVKIIYDRGNIKQVVKNHQLVPESEYTTGDVKLPAKHEIPNIDMEVINYHRPMLGTFHAKFMVVDRRLAVLTSNNIQDIDNVEMMTHVEGPIVDSIYDSALITWHNALNPPMPRISDPAAAAPITAFQAAAYGELFKSDGSFKMKYPGGGDADPAQSRPDGLEKPHEHLVPGKEMERLPEHTTSDPHYDPDIVSEVLRIQSVVSPFGHETRRETITRHLNTTIQPNTNGDAPECEHGEEMRPYIPHSAHDPFPIAMVNRKPHGNPDKAGVYCPQNEAWLSGLRNATKEVFIQTPDLNAEPLIPEIMNACRRGVVVTCYLCLGYNDAGELLPMQGGTNEMISSAMHKGLDPEHRKNLHMYFYVAKDMSKPVHAKFKKRSCHIKLMIIDQHIGIQGSGNQDTQSWYHSQEINILLDSPKICKDWIDGIRRNQNTHIYGKCNPEDGVWRDSEGKEAEGAIGIDPGRMSWAKGIVGAIQRVRGAGGF